MVGVPLQFAVSIQCDAVGKSALRVEIIAYKGRKERPPRSAHPDRPECAIYTPHTIQQKPSPGTLACTSARVRSCNKFALGTFPSFRSATPQAGLPAAAYIHICVVPPTLLYLLQEARAGRHGQIVVNKTIARRQKPAAAYRRTSKYSAYYGIVSPLATFSIIF